MVVWFSSPTTLSTKIGRAMFQELSSCPAAMKASKAADAKEAAAAQKAENEALKKQLKKARLQRKLSVGDY